MLMNEHPLSGKSVGITLLSPHPQIQDGDEFRVENWALLVNPEMWKTPAGAMFVGRLGDAADYEQAVYGKVGYFGHILLHDELTG